MWSLCLLSLVLPDQADAAIVEISPGDDLVTLTSSLGPGDEVIIADGVYEIDSTMVWSGAGTESEPIIIRASGTNAVIRQTTGSTIASIRDASFVEVRGLRLESSEETYEANRSTGIEVRNSTDISIRNNTISHIGGTGIYVGADSGLTSERVELFRNHVEDLRDGTGIYLGCNDVSCTVLDVLVENNWVHELSNGTGIYLANGAQGTIVVDNVVYQTSSWGLQTQSTTFGPSNIIERNVFWSNDHGIRAAGASEVRNNVVFLANGYGILSENNNRDEFEEVHISHNTVWNTGDRAYRLLGWQDRTGMVFANNVGTNTDGRAFETDGDTVSETAWIRGNVFSGLVNNLDPGSGAYVPGGGEGDYSSPDDWDFYPDASSVLLGAGDTSGEAYIPDEDFNGAPRDGANPTVGAYEWSTADNPGWVVSEGFKTPGFTGGGGEEVGGCCIRDANAPEAGLWGVPLLLLWGARRRREDPSSVNDA